MSTPSSVKFQPPSYSADPISVEESLTYFEYHRLGFHKDLTFSNNNYDNNNSVDETVTEKPKESTGKPRWRISSANQNFELCTSYPKYIIVPAEISDEKISTVSNFRCHSRVPAITWRYFVNGCVLARCSQPFVGWWGSRCDMDEHLFESIVKNSMNRINRNHANAANNSESEDPQQLNQANCLDDNQEASHEANQAEDNQEANHEAHLEEDNQEAKSEVNQEINLNVNQEVSPELDSNPDRYQVVDQVVIKEVSSTLKSGDSQGVNQQDNQDVKQEGSQKTEQEGSQEGKEVKSGCNPEPWLITGDSSLESEADMVEDISFNSHDFTSEKKLLVVDARSYTAAIINRAKGGGVECAEYYSCCEVQFMGLANIHSIRKSYNTIVTIVDYEEESEVWLSIINGSKWLYYVSSLLKSALIIVEAMQDCRSSLVHCSDGWDRTPQLVSLVQLIMDPYYRTIDGFRVLIEKEWLEFGHKFADRNGANPDYDDPYEKSPIFHQWLDSVQQLVYQFTNAFEFNLLYLETILTHVTSAEYGTFSCNNVADRVKKNIYSSTPSLWSYLETERHRFINKDYLPRVGDDHVLTPATEVTDMRLWSEMYCKKPTNGVEQH